MMDRAIWITWYDLPAESRDAYLTWLHGSYIPRLLNKPGFLWAAHYASEPKTVHAHDYPGRFAADVPGGNDYILLFGAETTHAFARPVPHKLHAELPPEDRKLLAMRTGERTNIFVEDARADGPEGKHRDAKMALSPCIQLGSLNARAYQDEEEMLDWYANWRMPSMQQLRGCVGIRKLVSVAGWAKHGALYEFVSVAARNDCFLGYEKPNPEMEAWSNRLVPKLLHAPGSANVGRRIWSAVK
jgi:hypothetical protein